MATKADNVHTFGQYINGEWKQSAETFAVCNKYTGKDMAVIGKASRREVDEAVDAAAHTFKTNKLAPVQRYEILMRAAEIVKKRKDELARIIVGEVGKVLKDASGEVERGIQTLIASAEEAKRIAGQGIPLGQPGFDGKLAFTVRVPVGVVGAITPFNFPLNLTLHKLGPALAAGNTVVLKPAELTPVTACVLADIFAEAGLPAGFLNVVNGIGREAGQYLLENDKIAMFTFTGSPEVGRHIKSATGIRKVTLELGNNSPNIVHEDAPDLAKAAELCVLRGVANNGQACISVQRVYVHRNVYDSFVQEAIRVAASLKVGNPEDPATDVGPMISEKEAKRVRRWIEEAVAEGARVACGGQRNGAFFEPTILVDVKPDMKVMCGEIFAPAINIVPYDDIDQAFRWANDTRFGLQAGLFTTNLQLALRAAHELEFGGVIVNDVSTLRADVMPYGGMKDSGVGREGPKYAVQEMTDERLVVISI